MEPATLKADVESAIKAKKLSGDRKLETYMAILGELEKLDMQAELKLKIAEKGKIASTIVGAASVFLGFFAEVPMLFIITPFAIAGLVVSFIFYSKYKAIDFDNGFRLYLKPMLNALADDIKKERAIAVSMDLSPITDKANLKSVSDQYSLGAYHKCYDHLYERELLTCTIPLYDGNRLFLSVHETCVKIRKTKRNPRGKIKTKYKYKRQTLAIIRLRVNPAKYKCLPVPETLTNSRIKKISLKPGDKGPLLTLVGVSKIKQESYSPDPQTTLRQMLMLYSYLKPVTAAE